MHKIGEESVYEGRILDLKIEHYELDGKILKRELVVHKDAVAILPVDNQGYTYLVKQYRSAIKDYVLEVPAGLVEDGEDYEEAALRELQEEVGFTAKNLEKVFQGYNSVGFCTKKTTVYIANDLSVSKLPEDDDEDIEIVKIHIDDLKQMYYEGKIKDFKTAIAILNHN
ncbi:NUDIX hydrolase [Actinomyces sp. zg-332]|uniref:NUDIX hydrolase n=1 Tax=Actinomyces sp. zg-332 TaxID=2708340 RepID=UPI0018E0749F|nr:NUDIX hydrolase [Actinomyces sp. zg-332]QPK94663.1 NUDIX hydrolase [Actinomyces sp. zg-332]